MFVFFVEKTKQKKKGNNNNSNSKSKKKKGKIIKIRMKVTRRRKEKERKVKKVQRLKVMRLKAVRVKVKVTVIKVMRGLKTMRKKENYFVLILLNFINRNLSLLNMKYVMPINYLILQMKNKNVFLTLKLHSFYIPGNHVYQTYKEQIEYVFFF